jgi:hypothetical protein
MAFRIFACLALIALSLTGSNNKPGWHFYPINSEHVDEQRTASGLVIYFANPPGDSAKIEALIEDAGKVRTVKGAVDTDGRVSTLFAFPIQSLDGFKVQRIVMTIGSRTVAVDWPKSGQLYGY